jgi:hypothetical protein
VACPFFFPVEKSSAIGWAFPARLPLGAGYCGTCRAGNAEVMPSETELRDFCNIGYANLGYSGHCHRMPAVREADCVRFAVSKDEGPRIAFHFVYEREHEPVRHGIVEYDCVAGEWIVPINDAIVQRQAECYLAGYLERRPRVRAVTVKG